MQNWKNKNYIKFLKRLFSLNACFSLIRKVDYQMHLLSRLLASVHTQCRKIRTEPSLLLSSPRRFQPHMPFMWVSLLYVLPLGASLPLIFHISIACGHASLLLAFYFNSSLPLWMTITITILEILIIMFHKHVIVTLSFHFVSSTCISFLVQIYHLLFLWIFSLQISMRIHVVTLHHNLYDLTLTLLLIMIHPSVAHSHTTLSIHRRSYV